jgi:hypothetical protein
MPFILVLYRPGNLQKTSAMHLEYVVTEEKYVLKSHSRRVALASLKTGTFASN